MKKTTLQKILPLALLCMSMCAQADEEKVGIESVPGMKDHFNEALKSGSSAGEMKDGVGDFFKQATGSNEPVFFDIKRIQQFKNGCGRLHGVIKQSVGGVVIEPWFEVNICPDGHPPEEKIAEMKAKQQEILKACKVSIKKQTQEKGTGITPAMIHATGCAKDGVAMTHWRYTGDCDYLFMPEGMATNTPVKDGRIDIALRIPAQCLDKNNVWTAVIDSKEGLAVGEVKAVW